MNKWSDGKAVQSLELLTLPTTRWGRSWCSRFCRAQALPASDEPDEDEANVEAEHSRGTGHNFVVDGNIELYGKVRLLEGCPGVSNCLHLDAFDEGTQLGSSAWR